MGIIKTAKKVVTSIIKTVKDKKEQKILDKALADYNKANPYTPANSTTKGVPATTNYNIGNTFVPPKTTPATTNYNIGNTFVPPKTAPYVDAENPQYATPTKLSAPTPVPYNHGTPTPIERKLSIGREEIREENAVYETAIQKNTTNYAKQRFDYYQDLVNKRKIDIEEANRRYKQETNNYQATLIDTENTRRTTSRQDLINQSAIVEIGEFQSVIDPISTTPPKKTAWQTIVDVAKSVPVSVSRYTRQTFNEGSVEDIAKERDASVLQSLLWGSGKIFNTIPLKQSYALITEERNLQYEANQEQKMMEALDQTLKNTPDELKYDVQIGAMNVLKNKGVTFEEKTNVNVDQATGNITTEKVYQLTGKEYDRKISESIYRMEKSKTTFENPSMKALDMTMTGTGIFTKTFAENWAGWELLGAGLKLGKAGYEALGGGLVLEGINTLKSGEKVAIISKEAKALKTIQLAEGTASVPKTYGTAKAIGTGLVLGFVAYEKVKQYKQYDEMSATAGKDVFWLETAGALAGFEAGTGFFEGAGKYAYNKVNNLNLQTIPQADISQTGFTKATGEKVFMERYGGFKLSKPTTWLKSSKINYAVDQTTGEIYAESIGSPKGSFVKRKYKFLPDELVAYYKYGGEVSIYDKAGILKRTIRAEAFPMDAKQTHYDWFMNRNIKEYPVPVKSKLPINVKDKGFGYSATGETWADTTFATENIFYGNGKVLKTKGAIQYYSGKGVSAGFLRVFGRGTEESAINKVATSPRIYAGYFDNIKLNKAIKEIKGLTEGGRELKAYLFRKSTGKAGTGNIPLMKREVELQVEIEKRIPIRKKYKINVEGWSVPIEEQIFAEKSGLSSKQLKEIIKEVGKVEEITKPQYSSLPSKTKTKPFISSVGGSRSSSTSSMSRIISQMNSDISSSISASRSFKSSFSSRPSRSIKSIISSYSGISRPSSSIISSSISSSSRLSPPSKPYGSSFFFPPKLSGKSSRSKRLKKGIWELGLIPDFTARIVGLPSPEYSVKDIEKELLKVQTGAGIRTGGRIKWE